MSKPRCPKCCSDDVYPYKSINTEQTTDTDQKSGNRHNIQFYKCLDCGYSWEQHQHTDQ